MRDTKCTANDLVLTRTSEDIAWARLRFHFTCRHKYYHHHHHYHYFQIIAITIIIYVIISIIINNIINITNVVSKDMAKAWLPYILPSPARSIVHLTRDIGLVDFKFRGETGIALSTAVSIFVDILVYMFIWIDWHRSIMWQMVKRKTRFSWNLPIQPIYL